jgi:hypothetical protein
MAARLLYLTMRQLFGWLFLLGRSEQGESAGDPLAAARDRRAAAGGSHAPSWTGRTGQVLAALARSLPWELRRHRLVSRGSRSCGIVDSSSEVGGTQTSPGRHGCRSRCASW